MKIKNFLIASFIAAFVSAGPVSAATIDLGTLAVGDSNSNVSTTTGASGFFNSIITGLLPDHSQITFTYALNNFSGVLADQGTYSFHTLTTQFDGSTASNSLGASTSTGTTNPVGSTVVTPSNALVLSSANITGNVGTATITNTSISTANFAAVLIGFLSNGGAIIGYTVTALSNVPLPASAYMFGMGLLALAGMNMFKKKQQLANIA